MQRRLSVSERTGRTEAHAEIGRPAGAPPAHALHPCRMFRLPEPDATAPAEAGPRGPRSGSRSAAPRRILPWLGNLQAGYVSASRGAGSGAEPPSGLPAVAPEMTFRRLGPCGRTPARHQRWHRDGSATLREAPSTGIRASRRGALACLRGGRRRWTALCGIAPRTAHGAAPGGPGDGQAARRPAG